MRNCYAAALNAGGRPSGAPSYRDGDCTCFNAAVEDFDGNTVEFIYRERPDSEPEEDNTVTQSQSGQIQLWQKDVAKSSATGRDVRVPPSKALQTRSRARTALDLASSVSTSTSVKRSDVPKMGISRSRTAPAVTSATESPRMGPRTVFGTLMGAAAGAALIYAVSKTENENARAETAFNNSMRARPRRYSFDGARSPRNLLDYSDTQSARSSRHPRASRRAIEAAGYYDDDDTVRDVVSRSMSSRRPPPPSRSMTYDAVDYAPTSYKRRNSRDTTKRSSTMPIDEPLRYIEAPRSNLSRQTSHRSGNPERHDSVISSRSHRSRRPSEASRRPSEAPPRHSRRGSTQYDSPVEVPLPPSKQTSYSSAPRALPHESRTKPSHTDPDDSDGMSDMKTVVPDDSISCVDFSKPKPQRSTVPRNNSSTNQHRTPTDSRPAARSSGSRYSAMTLPIRPRLDDYQYGSRRGENGGGRRSAYSYA